MTRARRRTRRQDGQSLVELAIVLPVLMILMLAVADIARIYATMNTLESAAREAADWGAFRPGNWAADADPNACGGNPAYVCTLAEMQTRACTPPSGLPEFLPSGGDGTSCTNPTFTCSLVLPSGSLADCGSATQCATYLGSGTSPCKVKVDLVYEFRTITPLEAFSTLSDLGGIRPRLNFGTFTISRESVFNVADTPASSDGSS